jgi:hypothetical protein
MAYITNVGDARKIRIIYTKNIDHVSIILDNYYYFQEYGKTFNKYIFI